MNKPARMRIHQQNLQPFNTFGLASIAEQYVYLHSLQQLEQLQLDQAPSLLLGGGSNLLLLGNIPGLTLHMGLQSIELLEQRPDEAGQTVYTVRVGAGVNWHQFVLHSLQEGWNGLENLILIPGTVGAAPVQNIGAYGLEVAEKIVAVHAYAYGSGPMRFSAEDCQFGYRNSRFKQENGRYLITHVDFQLGGSYQPVLSYGAVAEKLLTLGYPATASPRQIAAAVLQIRLEKLPNWVELGNSGSFFKNPIVPQATYEELLASYPDIPSYPGPSPEQRKIPAAWLIEQAGWKGKRIGAVGCYHKQALVIVNYGGASGHEILQFSEALQADVLEKFGVALEPEVQVVGR